MKVSSLSWPRTVVVLALVQLLPIVAALTPGKVISSADVLLRSYLFADARPPEYVPANSLLTDPPKQFIPWRRLVVEEIRSGRLPFWNPFAYGGAPLLGNSQSAVFDPLATPYLLVSDIHDGTEYVVWLRGFVAGLGVLLFMRRMGRSPSAGLLAASAYSMGGFMVVWRLYPHTSSAAWLPWALWAAERLTASPSWRNAAFLALAISASVFGGHIEVAFLVALVATIWIFVRSMQQYPRSRRQLTQILILLIGAGVLTASLSAVHTLPFLESLSEGTVFDDRDKTGQDLSIYSIASRSIRSLVSQSMYRRQLTRIAFLGFPYLFGRPLAGEPTISGGLANFSENNNAYGSLLALSLAFIAVVTSVRGTPERVLAGIGITTFLYCNSFLPFLLVAKSIPVIRLIFPERAGFIPLLAIALLAGSGLDLVLGSVRSRRLEGLVKGLGLVAMIAALCGLALVGALWLGAISSLGPATSELANGAVSKTFSTHFILPQSLIATGAGLLLFFSGRWKASVGGLAILVVLVDLLVFGGQYNPVITHEQAYPETEAISAIQKVSSRGRAVIFHWGLLSDAPTYYGIPDVAGYDAIKRRRRERLACLAEATDQIKPGKAVLVVQRLQSWFFEVMAVSTVVRHREIAQDGLILENKLPSVWIYKNTKSRPFIMVPELVLVEEDTDAVASTLIKADIDHRTTVVVESSDFGSSVPGTADIMWHRTNPCEIRIDTKSETGTMLVVAESYDSGWTARIDGNPAQIYPCDLAVMAVPVPQGQHQVVIRFQPRSWPVALALTFCGLLAIAVIVIRSHGRFGDSKKDSSEREHPGNGRPTVK